MLWWSDCLLAGFSVFWNHLSLFFRFLFPLVSSLFCSSLFHVFFLPFFFFIFSFFVFLLFLLCFLFSFHLFFCSVLFCVVLFLSVFLRGGGGLFFSFLLLASLLLCLHPPLLLGSDSQSRRAPHLSPVGLLHGSFCLSGVLAQLTLTGALVHIHDFPTTAFKLIFRD